MSDNLTSVIIPVYNVEKYLEKCLNSLLNQTMKDFEIILVDDGSRDMSGEICDCYEKKDSRIKVIHKKNGGLSSARNKGIEMATGKFLMFIDSDDWVHPRTLELLIHEAIFSNAEIVQCNIIKLKVENDVFPAIDETVRTRYYSRQKAMENLYIYGRSLKWLIICNKLYRRELFCKIRFPLKKINEDNYVTYRLFDMSRKIAYINLPLYYYRQRPDSIMGNKKNSIKFDRYEALREQTVFYRKKENKRLIYLVMEEKAACLAEYCRLGQELNLNYIDYYKELRKYWFQLFLELISEKKVLTSRKKFLLLYFELQMELIKIRMRKVS